MTIYCKLKSGKLVECEAEKLRAENKRLRVAGKGLREIARVLAIANDDTRRWDEAVVKRDE
jgi:hypothetical protein